MTLQMVSSSPAIRKSANDGMDKLIDTVDNLLMVQSITSILQFGTNPKVKPILIEKLIHVVLSIYEGKPSIVVKYIVPISVKLLKEPKRDIKTANDKLLMVLYESMGAGLLSHTGNSTPAVRDRIATLTKAA